MIVFQIRFPDETIAYFGEHPWVKPSKLLDRLAREHLGLPQPKRSTSNRYEIRVADDVWAAIEATGQRPSVVLRALLSRYVDEQEKQTDDVARREYWLKAKRGQE